MGATSWHYYTPYLPDPEAALQALRADVFARGDYVDLTGSTEDALRQMARRFGHDPNSPEASRMVEENLRLQRAIDTGDTAGLSREDRSFARRVRWFGWLARLFGASSPTRRGRPRTIDELLEAAEDSGTHSVLDIEHVGERPTIGVAAPLSAAALRRLLGTTEPTHDQVETHWADIAESLKRGHARYLAVHLDGQLHEYAFIGCTGD
jgi:hypothetical protein